MNCWYFFHYSGFIEVEHREGLREEKIKVLGLWASLMELHDRAPSQGLTTIACRSNLTIDKEDKWLIIEYFSTTRASWRTKQFYGMKPRDRPIQTPTSSYTFAINENKGIWRDVKVVRLSVRKATSLEQVTHHLHTSIKWWRSSQKVVSTLNVMLERWSTSPWLLGLTKGSSIFEVIRHTWIN